MDILHVRLLGREGRKSFREQRAAAVGAEQKVPLSQHQLLELHVSVDLVASSAGTSTGKYTT